MSYCRFGWEGSAVYVYQSEFALECCGCCLREVSFQTTSRSEMIKHLEEHKSKGNCVPPSVIVELTEEIEKEGDEI